MPTQKKIDTVSLLQKKIKDAKSVILAEYSGLKHKQLEEIRRELKKHKGELIIAKNRLMLRSLGDKADLLRDALKNPTAVLFSYDDEVRPLASLLSQFSRAGAGKTKAGLLGDSVLSENDIIALSKLPGKDAMRSRLAGQLQAPISGLHYALSWNMKKLVWALGEIKQQKTQ